MLDEIRTLLKAKTGLIYLVSYEEERVEDTLHKVCLQLEHGLFKWDLNRGFDKILDDKYKSSAPTADSEMPEDALLAIQKYQGDAVFILKDFQRFLDVERVDGATRYLRTIRNLVRDLRSNRNNKTIVILSPVTKIPEDLEHDLTVVDFVLPDYNELRKAFTHFITKNRLERKIQLDDESTEKVIKSLQGLTVVQAERALSKIFVKYGKLHPYHIKDLLAEKKQIISKTGVLEYIDVNESMDDIGGLSVLKDWLQKRSLAFSEKAKQYGLPTPKGILLVGVQGVGKSLTAKAVAATWKLPLVRLDVGSVFGSLVGESEERIRQSIKIAEAISPCILWIDEIDKAFAGVSGNQGDSGTSARVFGSLLTWMQEKEKPVFVVATANNVVRISGKGKETRYDPLLPPELLRKGRFDELFFLDLPTEQERIDIFQIMTKKYSLGKYFDYELLARKSGGMVSEKNDRGYGGAEIEQIVIEAMYKAFYDNERKVTNEDIISAMNQTKPLYELMQDQIDGLRKWADGRTRFSS